MAGKVKRVDFTRKGKWLTLLFIAFILYFAVILVNQQITMANLAERKDQLNREIAETELYNSQLRNKVNLLRTDMDYIESFARQELGLVREGETVYILPRWKDQNNE